MTRRVVAAVALVAIACFALLTLLDIVRHGIDVLALLSVAVLVVLGVGIAGALAQPPPEE